MGQLVRGGGLKNGFNIGAITSELSGMYGRVDLWTGSECAASLAAAMRPSVRQFCR
jgi:hypothetical protein